MRFLEKRMKSVNEFFNSIIEKPLLTSSLVLVLVTVLVLGLSLKYYLHEFDTFVPQILA
jgi:Tfp pilus assembly protein PilO